MTHFRLCLLETQVCFIITSLIHPQPLFWPQVTWHSSTSWLGSQPPSFAHHHQFYEPPSTSIRSCPQQYLISSDSILRASQSLLSVIFYRKYLSAITAFFCLKFLPDMLLQVFFQGFLLVFSWIFCVAIYYVIFQQPLISSFQQSLISSTSNLFTSLPAISALLVKPAGPVVQSVESVNQI